MSNHCEPHSVLREVRDGSETNPQAPHFERPQRSRLEAAERLAKLCQQLEDHIDEYKFERDQTGVSFELVRWFVDAVKAAKKAGGSLEQALGLRRGKGRPKRLALASIFKSFDRYFS